LTTLFVDTSALAKRYVVETGSAWVRSWILPRAGNTIVISRLATVEMIAMLARKQREGKAPPADILRVRNDFLAQVRNQYTVIELENQVLSRARSLLIKHPIRSLDAIQLASALHSSRILTTRPTFVSADTRLLATAAVEGLTTDDPNAHP
jgi:hypothetical protein